jgi:hypothetical protein
MQETSTRRECRDQIGHRGRRGVRRAEVELADRDESADQAGRGEGGIAEYAL